MQHLSHPTYECIQIYIFDFVNSIKALNLNVNNMEKQKKGPSK